MDGVITIMAVLILGMGLVVGVATLRKRHGQAPTPPNI